MTGKLLFLLLLDFIIVFWLFERGIHYLRTLSVFPLVGFVHLLLGIIILGLFVFYLVSSHFGKTIRVNEEGFEFTHGRQRVSIPWHYIALFRTKSSLLLHRTVISNGTETVYFNDLEFKDYEQIVEVLRILDGKRRSKRIIRQIEQ